MSTSGGESSAARGVVRIYLDSEPVDVAASATALDAVASWNPARADLIRAGSKVLVDNRGLPTDPHGPIYNGAIFRIVSDRQARPSPAEERDLS